MESRSSPDTLGNRETGPGAAKEPPRPSLVSASLFYAGIILFGLAYLWFGADLLWRTISGPRFSLIAAGLASVFLISGLGLIRTWNWVRILVLVYAPFLAFSCLRVMPRFKDFGVPLFLWVALSVFVLSFVYLLLPPVKIFFRRPKGAPLPLPGREERRLADIPPAPRKISLPLKLAVLFGNSFTLVSLLILALVSVPTLNKFNRMLGGLNWNIFSLEGAALIIPSAFLFFAAISMVLLLWGLKASALQLDRLRKWRITHGKLKSKTEISSGDSSYYRLRFEYEAEGKNHSHYCDVAFLSRFRDEKFEPMLYDPAKPERSMLVDELPAHITAGPDGELKSRYPFMGWVYASLPLLLLAVMAYSAFR